MASVLTIGGTRFIGRHTVEAFLEAGDDVAVFTRGNVAVPFEDADHVRGDRTNNDDFLRAHKVVDPDVVVDLVAYHPDEVAAATEVFADADRGVRAMSVRPTAVYGPSDPTGRQNYWIDRVRRFDPIVVPSDGYWMLMHLAYVVDVARAIRLVADGGESGEAYNVADRYQRRFHEFIGGIAGALRTSVTVVRASPREPSRHGLEPADFSLCRPYPYVVSTAKLAALGWESTPFEHGIAAVEAHFEGGRGDDGRAHGPDRDTEVDLLAALDREGIRVGDA